MTWSRSGTVAVTQGSNVVTGTGTDFFTQRVGWLFWLMGDRPYEIAGITSSTDLTLVDDIEAATASGLGYLIIPTQGDLQNFRVKIDALIASVSNARQAWDLVFETFAAGNYQLWLNEGNTGTVQEFLDFLIGPQGLSAYDVWLEDGNSGPIADFWEFLRGPQGIRGIQGEKGWSPVLATVADNDRSVLQVQGWVGGVGTAPATGQYLGPAGLVTLVADAFDIRGGIGPQGAGLVLSGVLAAVGNLPTTGVKGDAYLVGAASPRDVYIWNETTTVWDNGGPLEGVQGIPGPPGTTDYNLLSNRPTLGTAAATAVADYATAAQGTKADAALPAASLPLATQTQMEAGTDTTTRRMSPAQIKQAIDALGDPGTSPPISKIAIATSVSSVEIALPDGYVSFDVVAHLSSSVIGVDVDLQVRTTGSGSFSAALGNYTQDGSNSDRITLGNGSGEWIIEAGIFGAKDAGQMATFKTSAMNNGTSQEASGQFSSATTLDALRIFSGQSFTGTIWLYGREDT